MANGSTTYSFKDSSGAFVSPLTGPFVIAGGKVGAGNIVVKNTVTRSEIENSNDGASMTSYIAGSNGGFSVDVQQTSALHKYFVLTANAHQTAADANDVSDWAGSTLQIRDILNGIEQLLTGISCPKIPDYARAGKGQMITWDFLAANVTTLSSGA